jgi:hypothetical protein
LNASSDLLRALLRRGGLVAGVDCVLIGFVGFVGSQPNARMGSVCRCTYFLRAKGLTRPQKPSRDGAARGALPLAVLLSVEDDWVC